MAIRRILYLGEPILREVARPVEVLDAAIAALAEDMIETMLDAPGLGLSAPQVGASVRLIVVRVPRLDAAGEEEAVASQNTQAGHCTEVCQGAEAAREDKASVLVLANPEIVKYGEESATRLEGCLSLPTLQGLVTRPDTIIVHATTLEGEKLRMEASGLLSRVLQHEIDHLNGVLFIDRADPESLHWLVPDEEEETGYREEPTTPEEVVERFERLRQRRLRQQAETSA